MMARIGGEEFGVLLPSTDPEGIQHAGNRLRQALAASPVDTAAGPLEVTVSIGVATLTHPPAFANALELLAAADDALYRAKKAGRNRVAVAGEEK